MHIEDEERVRFDQEEYERKMFGRFWKGIPRTVGAMLFYGGVCTIIFHLLRFVISIVLDYSFYKEEIAEYISLGVILIAYPLLVGFRHIENCGYLDEYDGCFSFKGGAGRIFISSAFMLIIPYMIALNVNMLIMYVYSMCYTHTDKVSELISEAFFHQIDRTTTAGIFIGATLVTLVFALALIPFYYLGRRNCRLDRSENKKVKVEAE